MSDIPPTLLAVMGAQGGVFTRTHALDCGLSPGRVNFLVRSGVLRVVRRGVYTTREHWDSLDQWRGQPRLAARAAHLTIRRSHVFSHDSAAHELGLDILKPAEPLVHVTKRGYSTAWTEYGIKHHYARFRPDQVVAANGFECLDVARTAIDMAREHGLVHGTVACDSALRLGVTRADLEEAYADMAFYPHVGRVRSAVDLARTGAESVGETLARLLVIEAGIGEPVTQFAVRLSGGVAWCDLRVGRHVIEFDGRIKYRGREVGGFATASPEEVVWAEKGRQNEVCSLGLGMSRLVWDDYWGARRHAAIERLRAENEVTVARFGTQLPPELAEFDRRMRALGVRERQLRGA